MIQPCDITANNMWFNHAIQSSDTTIQTNQVIAVIQWSNTTMQLLRNFGFTARTIPLRVKLMGGDSGHNIFTSSDWTVIPVTTFNQTVIINDVKFNFNQISNVMKSTVTVHRLKHEFLSYIYMYHDHDIFHWNLLSHFNNYKLIFQQH